MHGIIRTLLASTVLVGIAATGAAAADMAAKAPIYKAPPVELFTWTGWYVGLNGGGSWGNRTGGLDSFTTAPPTANFLPAATTGGLPAALGANHEGYFGGAQIGYNWQSSAWVYGLEADIQGADIGRTSTVTFGGGGGISPSVSTGRDHIDWFGTFRGRVGWAADKVLFYGTGGLAYGGVQSSVTNFYTPATSGLFAGSTSDTRVGWAAGAGIEWAFAPNWTIRGEYLHIDLGSTTVGITDPVRFPLALANYRFHHEVDAARIGINYKWGGPLLARY